MINSVLSSEVLLRWLITTKHYDRYAKHFVWYSILRTRTNCLFFFSIISQHWDGVDNWRPSSWNVRSRVPYLVNTIADNISVAMIFNETSKQFIVSTTKWSIFGLHQALCIWYWQILLHIVGNIPGMGSTNERRLYIVTSSLICWTHTLHCGYYFFTVYHSKRINRGISCCALWITQSISTMGQWWLPMMDGSDPSPGMKNMSLWHSL